MDTKVINKFFANNDCVTSYLRDIRKYKVPTQEEEIAMFERYKNGDETAKSDLMTRNQRFIFSVAKKYAKDETELMDYVGEGNLGLSEAIDDFDETRGVKFITFAIAYIRRSMHYYFCRHNETVTNSTINNLAPKIKAVKKDFFNEHGYYPPETIVNDLLFEKYGIEVKDNSYLYDITFVSIGNETPDDEEKMEIASDDIKTYNDRTAVTIDGEVEERNLRKEKISKVNEVVENLQNELIEEIKARGGEIPESFPDFREIFKMYYGLGYKEPFTLEEISCEFGIPENIIIKWINNCQYIFKKHSDEFKLIS